MVAGCTITKCIGASRGWWKFLFFRFRFLQGLLLSKIFNALWLYLTTFFVSFRPSPHSTIDGGHRFQHRLAQNSVPRLTEEVESSQQLSPNWAGLVRAAPAHTDNRRTPVDLTSRVIENERLQQGGKDHQRNVSPQWNNSSEPKFHSNGKKKNQKYLELLLS